MFWKTSFIICIEVVVRSYGKEDVTCSAPSVEKGQMMNVTCDFKEDMMEVKTRQGFVIQYYKDDTFSQSEEILDCYWTDSYQCTVYDERFIHDPHISRYVTVSLPHADERAEGLYVCQEIGILDDDPKACQFILEKSKGAQTTTVGLLEESTEGSSDPTIIIVAACLPALVIILVVVIVVFLRCRTQRRRNKGISKEKKGTELKKIRGVADRGVADQLLNDTSQPEQKETDSNSPQKNTDATGFRHNTGNSINTGISHNTGIIHNDSSYTRSVDDPPQPSPITPFSSNLPM